MNKATPQLYQFQLSHYCEKVRWALDFKGVTYQSRNLVPVLHFFTTKRLAKNTTVPILVQGESIVQDSTDIIDYLDVVYPEKKLSPVKVTDKDRALELEEYFDREVGIHLRRLLYFYILQKPELAKFLLLQGAPRYAHNIYAVMLPFVLALMKKGMNITKETAQKSQERVFAALHELNAIVKERKYLVGNSFSRADLTACALLGPVVMPEEYDFQWPPESMMPPELIALRNELKKEPFYNWVSEIYKLHRRPA